jgi:prevent-host-death family protein
MSRTVTATEAKNRLGALLAEAQDEPVIVEIRGAPKAAIISFDDLRKFEELQEAEVRRQSFKRLEQIRERIAARNADLSQEGAAALVERASNDIFEARRARRAGRGEQ